MFNIIHPLLFTQMRYTLRVKDWCTIQNLTIKDVIETIIKVADINFTRNIQIGVSGDIKEKFRVKGTSIEKFSIIGGCRLRKG